MTPDAGGAPTADGSDGAGHVTRSSPPLSAGSQPPWLRYLTHMVALGWGTAELAWWGGRTGALSFIALVLMADYGPRAVGRIRMALSQ